MWQLSIGGRYIVSYFRHNYHLLTFVFEALICSTTDWFFAKVKLPELEYLTAST